MPKQEGQKSKLLALLHIFEQQTDEEHLLNVPQLVELLARQGILCERKSVYKMCIRDRPRLVIVDPSTLATLPRRQYINGLAESVKASLLADPELFAIFRCV